MSKSDVLRHCKPGVLQYRCRRCGLTFADPRVPDIATALGSILATESTPEEWGADPARMVEVHDCGNGGLGMADLIGAEAGGGREELSPS